MTSKKKAGTDPRYTVYILRCDNGSFYTGIALDIGERLDKHRRGTRDSKFTRSFRPVELLARWKVAGTRGDALRVEHYIKKKGRGFKEAIIGETGLLARNASRDLGISVQRVRGPVRAFSSQPLSR
jgi:putative endonuclease